HHAAERLNEGTLLVADRIRQRIESERNSGFAHPDKLGKTARFDMLLVHRLAGGFIAVAAGGAPQTRKMMRDHHALAGSIRLDVLADLDDLTGDLVTCVDASTFQRLRPAVPLHGIAAANAAGHH